MNVVVEFQEERLDLDVPDDRLVAEWHGPGGMPASDVERLVREALENPLRYPPLRQAVVPGDRVVIALDAEISHPRAVLAAVCRTLEQVGVEAASTTVLVSSPREIATDGLAPDGVTIVVHDPSDRNQLAYLASTGEGRRVYLSRLATDADFVFPIGRLGYDPTYGYRGPWSTIFPGLSDVATLTSFRSHERDDRPGRQPQSPLLNESAEVSWLLGCQFHLGIVEGVTGPVEVLAGLESAVRHEGALKIERNWTFQPESRAELVLAGIGRAGVPTRVEDLADGLATAARLVQRGGKIVALSRAEGPIGPALRRLIDAGDRAGLAALRGHESDPDFAAALSLARTLAWADVYLLSALGQDLVEGLSMFALDRPGECRRLVASSGSCIVMSQAELTRAEVADERESAAG